MSEDAAELKNRRLRHLGEVLKGMTANQLFWLEKVINIFDLPTQHECFDSDLFSSTTLDGFGDALRIHHAFSIEPFSKDKFEYVLEQVLRSRGIDATLAPKGNRGHDITIGGIKFSLKTQADQNIKVGVIWISKFMELGKGQWGDKPSDLEGLRGAFLEHLKQYDRILTLRTLNKAPDWCYELVEIPKSLFEAAKNGVLEMMMDSRQFPKPGYCYVQDPKTKVPIYELYFDGGGERKLQVKNLQKRFCRVHASWKFSIPKI
jgi:type II restriction enzyme